MSDKLIEGRTWAEHFDMLKTIHAEYQSCQLIKKEEIFLFGYIDTLTNRITELETSGGGIRGKSIA